MSRGLSSPIVAELETGAIYPAHFIEFYFDSGTLRFTTAHSNIDWGGNTYMNSGRLISFGDISETQQLEISSMAFTASSVNQTMLALALSEPMVNREIVLRRGLVNRATYSLIDNPILLYAGRIKSFLMQETPGDSSEIVFDTGSSLSDFSRTAGRRNNQQDQEAYLSLIGDLSVDKGFEFSHQLQTDIKWGKP